MLDEIDLENLIRNTYHISAPFPTSKKEYIKKWCDIQVPLEIISEAFDICFKKKGSLNFTYINIIILDRMDKIEEGRKKKCPPKTLMEVFSEMD